MEAEGGFILRNIVEFTFWIVGIAWFIKHWGTHR